MTKPDYMMIKLTTSLAYALTLFVSLIEATRLEDAVEFKVLKHHPVIFRHAAAACERHGYTLAPFHERVIPLVLRAIKSAHVKKVWAAGNTRLNPAASIRRPSPSVHDLSVTFMEKHSPALSQKMPILCAIYHSQDSSKSSHFSSVSSSSSTSSSISSGPDMGYRLSKSYGRNKSKASKKKAHKTSHSSKPKVIKSKNTVSKKRTESDNGMLIVSSKKMPRFTVRVDGVPADPRSKEIQKLIDQLRNVPLHNHYQHQAEKNKKKHHHHHKKGGKWSGKKPKHAH